MKVLILMFSLDISGGNNILFNHVMQAREAGFDVTVSCPSGRFPAKLPKWHEVFSDKAVKFETFENAIAGVYDVVIPTYFETYFLIDRVRADRVVYFVQSIESRFFGKNLFDSERADLTYSLPTGYITVADWIGEYLKGVCGHDSTKVRNGLNKQNFRLEGPKLAAHNGKMRVLVEGAAGSTFKRTQQTIEYVRQVPGVELWWLTPHDKAPLPGVDLHLHGLPQSEIPAVMRSCDVMVKLSSVEGMFGPPLEMFHCGGAAITSDVTGHDEYMRDGINGIVIEQKKLNRTPDAVRLLRDSPVLLEALKAGATETAAQWPSAEETGRDFWTAVRTEAGRCRAEPRDVALLLDTLRRSCRTYLLSPRGGHDDAHDPHRKLLGGLDRYNRAVSEGLADLAAVRFQELTEAFGPFGYDPNDRLGLCELLFKAPAGFERLDFCGRLANYVYLRAMALLNFDNLPDHACNWFALIWHNYVDYARAHPSEVPPNALLAPQSLRHSVIAQERAGGAKSALQHLTNEFDLINPALLRRLSEWSEFWEALGETARFLTPGGDLSPSDLNVLRQLSWLADPMQANQHNRADLIFLALRGALQNDQAANSAAAAPDVAAHQSTEPVKEAQEAQHAQVGLAGRVLRRLRNDLHSKVAS